MEINLFCDLKFQSCIKITLYHTLIYPQKMNSLTMLLVIMNRMNVLFCQIFVSAELKFDFKSKISWFIQKQNWFKLSVELYL